MCLKSKIGWAHTPPTVAVDESQRSCKVTKLNYLLQVFNSSQMIHQIIASLMQVPRLANPRASSRCLLPTCAEEYSSLKRTSRTRLRPAVHRDEVIGRNGLHEGRSDILNCHVVCWWNLLLPRVVQPPTVRHFIQNNTIQSRELCTHWYSMLVRANREARNFNNEP